MYIETTQVQEANLELYAHRSGLYFHTKVLCSSQHPSLHHAQHRVLAMTVFATNDITVPGVDILDFIRGAGVWLHFPLQPHHSFTHSLIHCGRRDTFQIRCQFSLSLGTTVYQEVADVLSLEYYWVLTGFGVRLHHVLRAELDLETSKCARCNGPGIDTCLVKIINVNIALV